ncbi:glycosyltransferase family 2 protein [Patescibacteria group bacterium]|nr:glycosyltransferase family 2 protein [Patescibacteria group bacterium]
MKKIALIILHYKGKDFTGQCLESVKKLQTDNFKIEIIVVNNNPQENLDELKRKFKNFVFLETGKNLGFVGGNNFGIKRALKDKADYIFLINNDTTLASDVLVQLTKVAEEKKGAGILGPKIYFAPGYEYHRDRYKKSERGKVFWNAGGEIDWPNVIGTGRGVNEVDKGQYDQIEETDYVSGCGMFIKREVLDEIGFFDERYFLYYEDDDISVRAKKAGWKLLFVPQARMWHFNAGSSEVGGPLHDYYMARNRLLFGMKFAPLRAKIALFKWGLSRLIVGRPWQKIAFRDFLINRFGKGSYEA